MNESSTKVFIQSKNAYLRYNMLQYVQHIQYVVAQNTMGLC